MYSQVVKTTHLGLGYAAVTYGNWESQLTLFGGYTINHTDSLGYSNTKNDEIFIVQGAERVGENLKLGIEFFFISNFEIVPVLISMRYFDNNLTIDVGVAFSLYKAGAARTTKTSENLFLMFPIFPSCRSSAEVIIFNFFLAIHHFLYATTAQIISTTPNGIVPASQP